MTKIQELKQTKIPKEAPPYMTEFETRAIIAETLNNLNGNIRLVAGQITNSSGNTIITPTGSTIPSSAISAPALLGWTSTLTFSATDSDTVAWASGAITLSDGTVFSIDAGNTGDMTALTYIYLDTGTSETVLQTTTTASSSVGANKILIAVAEDTTTEATFQVFGGEGGTLFTADNIAANSITVNEMAANSVTATEINVATLSAIAANMGTITAGTITGATIRTAATGYRTVLTSANGIQFYNGATLKGKIRADTGDSIIYDSVDNHIFFGQSGDEVMTLNEDGITLPSSHSIFFSGGVEIRDEGSNLYIDSALEMGSHVYPRLDSSYDIGSADKRWRNGHFDKLEINGDIDAQGNIQCGGTFESSDGSDGISVSFDYTDSVWESSNNLYYNYRELVFKDGLLVDRSGATEVKICDNCVIEV